MKEKELVKKHSPDTSSTERTPAHIIYGLESFGNTVLLSGNSIRMYGKFVDAILHWLIMSPFEPIWGLTGFTWEKST